MAEIKVPVQPYMINFKCEEKDCKGVLMFTGQVRKGIVANQNYFIHKCNMCGTGKEFVNKQYPSTVFEADVDLDKVKKANDINKN